MIVHRTMVIGVLLAALSSAPAAHAAPAAGKPMTKPNAPALSEAIFAGGCFWCEETAFEGVKGVATVVSGYTGGHKLNPTYEEVSSGSTGHAESVKVRYDPSKISYAQLLDIFWHNVDPTQADGQFCDHGTQYRSAIFFSGEAQKQLALESKERIEASGRLHAPIVTQIVPASKFYPAEEYHQDFYKKSPVRYHAYRIGCGRDRRLAEIWGLDARRGQGH